MEKAYARTFEGPGSQRMLAWLPVAVYMALIFYFSSLSHPDEELPNFLFDTLGDKSLHAIEYAVLGVLCYRAFRRAAGSFTAGYAVVFAIVTASLYGATDELHQSFVPFRTATWLDWVADTAGGMVGAIGGRRVMERGAKDGFS
jgi:VanZ family protein